MLDNNILENESYQVEKEKMLNAIADAVASGVGCEKRYCIVDKRKESSRTSDFLFESFEGDGYSVYEIKADKVLSYTVSPLDDDTAYSMFCGIYMDSIGVSSEEELSENQHSEMLSEYKEYIKDGISNELDYLEETYRR